MSLSQDQIESIKDQLRQQVQHLPEDKKKSALEQIENMSEETIESLVKQQKAQSSGDNKSIFRMIVDKEIDAIDVAENPESIAVLDINPISSGHLMIIPKKAVSASKSIPAKCFSLAKKLSQQVIKKLGAKSAEIQTETKFGEAILHVIPIYKEPLNINSARQKALMDDLKKIAEKIRIVKKVKIPKIKIASRTQDSSAIQLKRRIA